MTTRRAFLSTLPAAAALLAVTAPAVRAQGTRLLETEPAATSIGYRDDATKVDTKKYPAYKPGSVCGNCQLYQGKAGAATGPCAAVGGKAVSAKGWCTVWIKKAG